MEPAAGMEDWEVTQALANAMGLGWNYAHPREILSENARLTPSFAGVSWERLEQEGSLQWPDNEANPAGSPVLPVEHFVRGSDGNGKGRFMVTVYASTHKSE